MTAVGCGLRKAEVSGIRWTDVDFDNGALTVQRSLRLEKSGFRLADTKTHKVRQVDLPDFVLEALRKQREVQSLEQRWHGSVWQNKHNLIFTTEIGTPLDPHNLLREWKKLLKATGLRYTTIHDLRHGGASLIRDAGGTLQDISEILGHSSIAITSRLYVHLFPERRRDLMDKVGKVISG
jgi:integrase